MKESSALNSIMQNIDTIYREVSYSMPNEDIGELFIGDTKSNSVTVLNNKINKVVSRESCGFSLRAIQDKRTVLISQNNLEIKKILEECKNFRSLTKRQGEGRSFSTLITGNLYDNYLNIYNPKESADFLKEANNYLKSQCNFVQQISSSLCTYKEEVIIITSEGKAIYDYRPLWSFRIWNSLKRNGEIDEASVYMSERSQLTNLETKWKEVVDSLVERNKNIVHAQKAKGGRVPVVLDKKSCGILLHEAVGHSLEADFNSRGTSVFSGKMNTQIASPIVTVVDDGTIPNARGSLNFDDEGSETQKNILIKDGVLVKYLSDKYNAKMMNTQTTGSGRREAFNFKVMPRMNNTYMEAGTSNLEDMINSIEDGVYAKAFAHGQVDITSGQFAFSGAEMYAIKKGKISHPLKNCTFSGMGSEVMKNISAVGNKLELDSGGTCGKDGQLVPVGMGMPCVLVNSMIVGG